MQYLKTITIGLVAFILLSNYSVKAAEKITDTLTVEINFGENTEIKSKTIEWKEGITALEALQYIAEVTTYSVGKYVIVTVVEGVAGERGKTAWYYEVNGVPAKVLAINNKVKPGDVITWIYKEDVCSKTVDGNKKSIIDVR